MKIAVLLKQTYDTEEKITIENGQVAEDGVKYIINPYDEYALEEALRLRERLGSDVVSTITAVSAGTERCNEALRTALALGADDAMLLQTDAFAGDEQSISAAIADDEHALSVALASLLSSLNADLILGGLFSVDRGAGQIALRIAELLTLPHASAAIKLELKQEGSGWKALIDRDIEGDVESVELSLPALITAQQGLNEPRYPSLPGIMKAKRKPLRIVSLSDLVSELPNQHPAEFSSEAGKGPGGSPSIFEACRAKTERTGLFAPPARAAGRKLAGASGEQAAELVKLLREEAKLF